MTTFERIKELAKKRDLSIKELSSRVGFGPSTIYKWKTQEPKSEYLKKVADYLGVSTDYLLGRDDETNTNKISEIELEKALENAMTWNGEPLTDKDKEAVRIFLEGRKSK
ncbi:helix-turn-helix domain-containing protein [Enterococcus mundtii]|uniref:Transcriptional regulator n=1 Tax=Enterococcus mundtii TaxID=53346 RepID=A0ABQ0VC78_ENTMU|nr:helix-turn-helix transcriptional regulator [Enterococcus mundtii]GEN18124.1 transcriptional regulator [Ligilactobacillus acidipiscis]AUB53022.1 transcriptional regulator [Enterococcus mundtii]MZZ58334.1 helix-turn-helix domain-containing protein [Enterococcus mundtii]MZZ61310.1 helix-turn-helix domain-containing protein [Enterococcus mundtii]MZZ68294.1 helix-turn-helix domain-containing protein [Enterococcus mundtii]